MPTNEEKIELFDDLLRDALKLADAVNPQIQGFSDLRTAWKNVHAVRALRDATRADQPAPTETRPDSLLHRKVLIPGEVVEVSDPDIALVRVPSVAHHNKIVPVKTSDLLLECPACAVWREEQRQIFNRLAAKQDAPSARSRLADCLHAAEAAGAKVEIRKVPGLFPGETEREVARVMWPETAPQGVPFGTDPLPAPHPIADVRIAPQGAPRKWMYCPSRCTTNDDGLERRVLIPGQRCPECKQIALFDR